MKINISNLSEGVHEYEFEETPSTIKLDERFSKPVGVQIEIEKRRRQLFLKGRIKTFGWFVCDRCLNEFENDISASYRMTYVYNPSEAGEIDKDELTVINSSTNEIKIDEEVRDYILLAIPFKLLCKPDCAGLCETCGANLNHGTCDCAKEKSETDNAQKKKIKVVKNN